MPKTLLPDFIVYDDGVSLTLNGHGSLGTYASAAHICTHFMKDCSQQVRKRQLLRTWSIA